MKLPKGTLELAISQANKSTMQQKHGAVIWKNKTIIGAGYNRHMPSSTISNRKVSIHSEKDCLSGLRCDHIYGSSVLTVRINKSEDLIHGEPCNGCKKLLKRKGVSKIYWYDNGQNLNVTYLN
tara:strand:- start:143 stop:511 length:369 start_codon:yes stop_codon:yes gene_type:complete